MNLGSGGGIGLPSFFLMRETMYAMPHTMKNKIEPSMAL